MFNFRLAHRAMLGLFCCSVVFLILTVPASGSETVLRRGNGSEPESLDPARMESVAANHVLNDLYEPLVTLDSADRPVPAAAVSWQVSTDGLVYIFHLRPNLRWSDGSPLTAEDFAYSLRRVVDPANGVINAYLLFPIKNARALSEGKMTDLHQLGVSALDSTTLRFILERPTPYWVALAAHGIFSPVKQAVVEKFGDRFTQPGHLVSNGPFMLQDWIPNSRMVLVRNPFYHDAAAVHLDRVMFYPIGSETEEFSRYRAGDLDVTDLVPSQQIDLIRANMAGELRTEPSLTLDFLGFNMEGHLFGDNAQLRQALSMAIDRQFLVDKILKTGAPVAYSAVPAAGMIDYIDQPVDWAWLPTSEKIAKAKQLYREAGYSDKHPLEVELHVMDGENTRRVANAIITMWQQTLGVRTALVAEEFGSFIQHRHRKGELQLFWYGWTGDYPDAETFLDLFVSGSADNDFGYHNNTYDRLMEEAELTVDPLFRAGLMEQAESVLINDTPVIPLYNRRKPYLVKPWVKGFHINPCGYSYDKEVTIQPH